MRKPIVVVPADRPRPLGVVGEHITVLAAGADTGTYEVFHQSGPDGSGPPPHAHDWDEAFYVTRGSIEFGIGDDRLTATAGTFVHLPAGTMHWFRFGPDGGEMLSLTSREGASRMFTEFDREIAPDRPDLGKLIEIAGRHGLTVAPPPA